MAPRFLVVYNRNQDLAFWNQSQNPISVSVSGAETFFVVELQCVVGRLEYTFSSKRSRQPQRSKSHLTVMLCGKPLAASTVETAEWLLLGIFVQKVFSKNLNFTYQQNKKSTKKIKPHLLCQFQMLTYQ